MTTVVVVGGGFYGATIALYWKHKRQARHVVLIEREPMLLQRSSFGNQARLHGGYHYPRSFLTGYRSVRNAPRFAADFGPAILSNFTKLYAMAHTHSKVTTRQMVRFCADIGAPLVPAPRDLARLFDPLLIAASFVVAEQASDVDILRQMVAARLAAAGVDVLLGHEAVDLVQSDDAARIVVQAAGETRTIVADLAFNCTYSRVQATARRAGVPRPLGLKHEVSEIALIEPPPELAGIGVTVMDGPFFSTMPFPARGLHSLSHVRYTPHMSWVDDGDDPYRRLAAHHRESRVDRMLRDAARYLPAMARARPRDALFEVKTVLARNEGDDGRPILFVRHPPHGRIFSVLGAKIGNVYDILDMLDAEPLPAGRQAAA